MRKKFMINKKVITLLLFVVMVIPGIVFAQQVVCSQANCIPACNQSGKTLYCHNPKAEPNDESNTIHLCGGTITCSGGDGEFQPSCDSENLPTCFGEDGDGNTTGDGVEDPNDVPVPDPADSGGNECDDTKPFDYLDKESVGDDCPANTDHECTFQGQTMCAIKIVACEDPEEYDIVDYGNGCNTDEGYSKCIDTNTSDNISKCQKKKEAKDIGGVYPVCNGETHTKTGDAAGDPPSCEDEEAIVCAVENSEPMKLECFKKKEGDGEGERNPAGAEDKSQKKIENPFDNYCPKKGDVVYAGAKLFEKCQTMIHSDLEWAVLVQERDESVDVVRTRFGCAWKDYVAPKIKELKKAQEWIKEANSMTDETQKETKKDIAKKKVEETFEALGKGVKSVAKDVDACVALLPMMHWTDWGKAEEMTAGQGVVAFDNSMKCMRAGVETQDYYRCAIAVNTYNGLHVTQAVGEEVQKYELMDAQVDAQRKFNKNPDDPTAGMKIQRDSIRAQSRIADQRAVFFAGKAATLGAMAGRMPINSDAVGKCNKYFKMMKQTEKDHTNDPQLILSKWAEEVAGQFEVTPPTIEASQGGEDQKGGSAACANSAKKVKLFMNGPVKAKLVEMTVKSGLDATANVMKGNILDKQADLIKDAIRGVKSPEDWKKLTIEQRDMITEYCAANPNAPDCANINDFARGVGFANTSIVVGGTQRATTQGRRIGDNEDGTGADDGSGGDGSSDRSGVPGSFGSGIAGVEKASGFSDPTVGAAVQKDGPGAGNAGGGGGGGGGSAAAPASGGRGGYAGAPGSRRGSRRFKGGYSGGKYAHRYSGSSRRRKSKGKKSSNPFASMFKKKKGRSVASTLDFRGKGKKQIKGKGGNIFQTISNRYGTVTQQKRLLEYERQQ